MGEYADYLIDDMMDAFPEWSPVGSYKESRTLQCKYCGSTNVYWKTLGLSSRYALFNKGENRIHQCQEYYNQKKVKERGERRTSDRRNEDRSDLWD